MNQKRSGKQRSKRPARRAPDAPAAESFESVARAAPVCIFRTDAVGRCIYVNERWTREGHPADRERIRRK